MSAAKAASLPRKNAGDGAAGGARAPRSDRERRNRALVAGIAAVTLLGAIALAAWLVQGALNRPIVVVADRAELVALDERLTTIQDKIRPIAVAFGAEPDTGLIEVGAYRTRIAQARRLVDSTSDLTVSGPEALEVRDLIITGGSKVLAGLDAALDALVSDDASATAPLTQVDEGLAALQDARDKLDALLGVKSGA